MNNEEHLAKILGDIKSRKMAMRCKKLYTTKQWRKFKKTKVIKYCGVKHNIDLQELMCQKYEIILTDHKTKWGKITDILKKINTKNIIKVIDAFSVGIQEFGKGINELTKDLDSPKKTESDKDKLNLEKLWGKSRTNMEIWSNSSENPSDSHRSRDEINLEKLWGKSTGIKLWPDPPKNQSKSQISQDEINLEKLWGKRN